MNPFLNGTLTGHGCGREPGGRRGGPHPVRVGHRGVQHRHVRPIPAAAAQPQAGVRHPVRAAGLGALPPPDTWAGNKPCWASLGELGWEGCADEEVPLSSCGLNPPTPASPRIASPAKPPPPRETQTPCRAPPPPKPTQPKKTPPPKPKSFESGSSSSSDQPLPRGHGKGKGRQPLQQKRCEEPPSLEGDESPDPPAW